MNFPTAITNSSVTWPQDKFPYNTTTKLGQYTKQCLVCSLYTMTYLQFFLRVVCLLQQVHCLEIDSKLSLWCKKASEIMCNVGFTLWWPILNFCMHCRISKISYSLLPFFLLLMAHQHSNYHKHCNNHQSYNRHSYSCCNS